MGDANANSFIGYNGADVIDAGAGNDYVRGGKGADILSGGAGIDWLEYKGSEGGVTVNLGLITAQPTQVMRSRVGWFELVPGCWYTFSMSRGNVDI